MRCVHLFSGDLWAGTALVALRTGGIPEVLGSAPWVVRRLLENGDEREAWCRALQRSFTDRYTIATTVDRTLAFYRDVLGSMAAIHGSGSRTS